MKYYNRKDILYRNILVEIGKFKTAEIGKAEYHLLPIGIAEISTYSKISLYIIPNKLTWSRSRRWFCL
jgi:hypothetical protein